MELTQILFSGVGALLVWAIQRQTTKLNENTTAIAVLTSHMAEVKEEVKLSREQRYLTTKNKEDLNHAYERIKNIEKALNG